MKTTYRVLAILGLVLVMFLALGANCGSTKASSSGDDDNGGDDCAGDGGSCLTTNCCHGNGRVEVYQGSDHTCTCKDWNDACHEIESLAADCGLSFSHDCADEAAGLFECYLYVLQNDCSGLAGCL